MRCWLAGLSVIPTAILSSPVQAVNPMCQAVLVACYNAPIYAPSRAPTQNKHGISSDTRATAASRDAFLRARAGKGNALPRLLCLQCQKAELERGRADCGRAGGGSARPR